MFLKQEKVVNKVVMIDVDKIIPNPAQPRRNFDESELTSLAESIKANGILQPLTIRKNKKGEYELIAGERRLKASKLIGAEKVPAIILDTTSRQSAIFALIENIQRKDLNYFEEAEAIRQLIVEWGVNQEEAAQRLGKAQSTIANKLRILKYDKETRKKMISKGISEHHARILLKVENSVDLEKAIHIISSNNLTVKETEDYLKQETIKKAIKKPKIIPVIKDTKLFLNTINIALNTIKKAGVNASLEQIDNDKFIEYKIKISK